MEEQTITTSGVGFLYGGNIFAHIRQNNIFRFRLCIGDSFMVNKDRMIQVMGTTDCLDISDFYRFVCI